MSQLCSATVRITSLSLQEFLVLFDCPRKKERPIAHELFLKNHDSGLIL